MAGNVIARYLDMRNRAGERLPNRLVVIHVPPADQGLVIRKDCAETRRVSRVVADIIEGRIVEMERQSEPPAFTVVLIVLSPSCLAGGLPVVE